MILVAAAVIIISLADSDPTAADSKRSNCLSHFFDLLLAIEKTTRARGEAHTEFVVVADSSPFLTSLNGEKATRAELIQCFQEESEV